MVPEERPVHDVEQDEAGGEEPPRDAVHQHGLLPPLLHQVTDFFLFLGMSILHTPPSPPSSPSAGTSCAHLRGLLVDTGDGDSREGEGRLGVLLLVLGGRGRGRGGQRGAVHVVALHTAVTTIIPRTGPCLVLQCLVLQLRAASRHAPVVSGLVLAAGAGARLVTSATSEPR